MKVRNGFVSNSSTSSFVIIMKKEHFESGMTAVHPYVKACIEALGISKSKYFEDEMVTLGVLDTHGGSAWEYVDVEYEGDEEYEVLEEMKYESLYLLQQEIEKIHGKDSVITASLDG